MQTFTFMCQYHHYHHHHHFCFKHDDAAIHKWSILEKAYISRFIHLFGTSKGSKLNMIREEIKKHKKAYSADEDNIFPWFYVEQLVILTLGLIWHCMIIRWQIHTASSLEAIRNIVKLIILVKWALRYIYEECCDLLLQNKTFSHKNL